MTAALSLWRLWPRQIEGGLSLYHHRSIDEWLVDDFTMSSRKMLSLLDELPETSKFKEVSERTFRVVQHRGRLVLCRPTTKSPDGIVLPAVLPVDATVIGEFVDWTHDRKIAARTAREMAVFRMESRPAGHGYDVDLSGLTEPLDTIVSGWHQKATDENLRGAKNAVRSRLFPNGKAVNR